MLGVNTEVTPADPHNLAAFNLSSRRAMGSVLDILFEPKAFEAHDDKPCVFSLTDLTISLFVHIISQGLSHLISYFEKYSLVKRPHADHSYGRKSLLSDIALVEGSHDLGQGVREVSVIPPALSIGSQEFSPTQLSKLVVDFVTELGCQLFITPFVDLLGVIIMLDGFIGSGLALDELQLVFSLRKTKHL
jgi:hypothetical protein